MAKQSFSSQLNDPLSGAEDSQDSENSQDSQSIDFELTAVFLLHKSSWSKAKRCCICNSRLAKVVGKRKHHCRMCGNTVCKEHSKGKKVIEGTTIAVRVCDNCNKSLANREFNSVLMQDISQLQSELTLSAQHLQSQQAEIVHAQKETEKLEEELEHTQKAASESKKGLEARVRDEGERMVKNLQVAETLRGAVRDSNVSSELIQSKFSKYSSEVHSLTSDLAHLTEQLKELHSRVERGTRSMQSRIHIAEITKVMCGDCTTKLYHMSFAESRVGGQPRKKRSSGMEGGACGQGCAVM